MDIIRKKRFSTVWEHFHIIAPDKVKCVQCGRVLGYSDNTSSMLRHLRALHEGFDGKGGGASKYENTEPPPSMPPKRESTLTQPTPVKMIKIGTGEHEWNEPMDDKYGLAEESSYSPYPNNQPEGIAFEEDVTASPGIRTDTITLLMKIEQLQAQLKYERRCRLLAERELRELKEMNTLMVQMRHTAHELRATLDHVLQGGEASVAPQSSDESLSFLTESEAEMRVHQGPEGDLNFICLTKNLRVPKNLYERIAEIADYKKYTSALLMMLFDRETLATHSLQGRRSTFTGDESQKPQLPPEILKSIIGKPKHRKSIELPPQRPFKFVSSLLDHVEAKFGAERSQIKTAIRTKLNNEDKLLKKRLGLGKTENKVLIDQNFCQEASFMPENAAMTSDPHL